jgi:hypothetical protein
MRLWKLGEDASIREVLTWCIRDRLADSILLATRIDTDSAERSLLEPKVDASVHMIFAASIRRTTWATAWPVTQLIGHPGRVYIIELNSEVVRRMSEVQDRLFGWTQYNDPPLPEDLCAFHVGDSLPSLVSITNEGDAWLLHERQPDVDAAREVPWEDELLKYIPAALDFVKEGPLGGVITQ